MSAKLSEKAEFLEQMQLMPRRKTNGIGTRNGWKTGGAEKMIARVGSFLLLFSLSVQAATVNELVEAKANKYKVDSKLVHAVIKTESAYHQNAISSAGAGGLMQLMPDTAKRFGVSDRFDPEQNIDGGVHYLRVLLDMFGGNVKLAVASYNAGEGAVQKYNGIPPYAETQDYVRKVLGFYGKDTPMNESLASAQTLQSSQPMESGKIKPLKGNYNKEEWKILCNQFAPGQCDI